MKIIVILRVTWRTFNLPSFLPSYVSPLITPPLTVHPNHSVDCTEDPTICLLLVSRQGILQT